MSKPRTIPPHIREAIKSGYVPKLRHWRAMQTSSLTRGEKICRFMELHLPIPEGPDVGKPCRVAIFQEVFILSVFDSPVPVRRAIMSMGRKGGKTALAANLLGAFLFMDGLCPKQSRINSGALSRDQASLVYNYLSKSIQQSKLLAPLSRVVPSLKVIESINSGVSYHALAAEAGKAMGLSPPVLVLDELGQVVGPQHAFADALLTSQGAYDQPLAIIISTQAASDQDWLSIQIDDAIRTPRADVVCHLYAADPGCDVMDEAQWTKACPALGIFRSKLDVKTQAAQALRMPTFEASFRNLILNQRVALSGAFLAPGPWKECNGAIDMQVFREQQCAIALDLSARNDLTAAVLAARDAAGTVHLKTYVFCPLEGIEERAKRDRAPYELWVKQGHLIPLGGRVMDYDQIAAWLRDELAGLDISPAFVVFDRWAISHFKKSADACGFASFAQWIECGQGYKDFSPRCKAFESLMLAGKLRHGAHPVLTMSAAAAIAEADAAGNVKLVKNKSSTRIDPLVAAVMAAFQVTDGDLSLNFDPAMLIG